MPATVPDGAAEIAARIAAAVRAHPDVARLDAGPHGVVASYLPGRRRIAGVRVGVGTEPVELAVVVRLGTPLPRLADELAAVVHELVGPVAVEVTFCDVVAGPEAVPDPSHRP
ncbi:hypothetical protein [Pseudonocardia nigra]|uniref:hypothetical protein n=1 Tax=Pseudonocardia nigra TaxID=1921578 RepID=UPI001C5F4D41|nr:hypothetical protein [Pseudonocardia nigra]